MITWRRRVEATSGVQKHTPERVWEEGETGRKLRKKTELCGKKNTPHKTENHATATHSEGARLRAAGFCSQADFYSRPALPAGPCGRSVGGPGRRISRYLRPQRRTGPTVASSSFVHNDGAHTTGLMLALTILHLDKSVSIFLPLSFSPQSCR